MKCKKCTPIHPFIPIMHIISHFYLPDFLPDFFNISGFYDWMWIYYSTITNSLSWVSLVDIRTIKSCQWMSLWQHSTSTFKTIYFGKKLYKIFKQKLLQAQVLGVLLISTLTRPSSRSLIINHSLNDPRFTGLEWKTTHWKPDKNWRLA